MRYPGVYREQNYTRSQPGWNQKDMVCFAESRALCTIKLNEDFRDDGQQSSAQIRRRIEMLVVILEDIEIERKHFHLQQSKRLERSQLDKVIDLINRGEYYLQELERCIQKSL
jgi:hypothetical protein